MKQKALVLLFLSLSLSGFSQILIPKKDYVPKVRKARFSFAFSLQPEANSKLVSFGIMRQNPDSTTEVVFISKGTLIRQASGNEESLANPNKENLFEKYNVNPNVLDIIWKLRYDKNPFEKKDILGWGTDVGRPSQMQYAILSEYGITSIPDYAYGENFWILLQKLEDQGWVGNYLSVK